MDSDPPSPGVDATRAADMRAIEASTSTSDLEVARNGARIAILRITWLEGELSKAKKRLATAESILISQAASHRTPRKIADRPDSPNYIPNIPKALIVEGQAIYRSAHRTARVYFMFFSTYSPPHIWNQVVEKLFQWNDATARWNPAYPENRKIGHAYELRQAADRLAIEWINQGSPAFKQEFEGSISDARSESIKRGRDKGPEVFDDFSDNINASFALLRQRGDKLPTYTRLRQDPIALASFGNSLFLSESAGARRLIPGLDSIIGIWERSPDVFESDPINARLLYKNYKVKAGEEFESEVLFRLCRCILYGPTSIMKKTVLALNTKSPLTGFTLAVTPGLIIGTITVARLTLSFDSIFSGDGKGAATKVRYDEDADNLLEALMKIWDTPRGKAIREVWTKNVFPSQATPSTAASSSQPAPVAPKPRRRAADQMAAREAAREEGHDQDMPAPTERYHVPTSGFDITTHHPLGNINHGDDNDDDEHDYADLVSKSFFVPPDNIGEEEEEEEGGGKDILQPVQLRRDAHREEEEDQDSAEGYNPMFDEEGGEVWDSEVQPRRQQGYQLPPVPEPEGLDLEVEFALTATSTPQRKRSAKPTVAASNSRSVSLSRSCDPTPLASSHPPQPSLAIAPGSIEASTHSPPTVSDTTTATGSVPSTKPKPKRTLSKREREALAVAVDGEGVGDPSLPPTQDLGRVTRRSARNTNDTAPSATANPPPVLAAVLHQMVGDSAEASSSSAQVAPRRGRGGNTATTAGKGTRGRGGKSKKSGT